MPTDIDIEIGARALCKLHGFGGCSMHCTYEDQQASSCPRAVKVWGHEAKAVVEALRKSEEGR